MGTGYTAFSTLVYLFAVVGFLVAGGLAIKFVLTLARNRRPRNWGPDERVSAVALATWIICPALALILPLGFASWGAMTIAFWIASSAGAFIAARCIRSGWRFVVPIGVLMPAAWAFSLVALWAFKSGWQGLDIQDVTSGDQGDGADVMWGLLFYIVSAPFWGLFLGWLSRIELRRPVGAPPS